MPSTMSELVQRATKGDQDAFSELYEQSYPTVYRTIKILVKNEIDVQDIMQNSYLRCHQSLGTLDDPEKFIPWMKRIARNQALDYLRKKHPVLFTDLENEDGDIPEFADDCIDHLPEEMLERAETARLLKEILDTLPEEQRAAIFMYGYEGMSVKKIADAMGCPEGTVKSRLKYGRDKAQVKIENLAAHGTKLYSLAPLPYLLWLLRMAKAQDIPASALCTATEATAGAAAATQAAAETAAKATGSAARGTAKGAAKAGTKSLSKKIVAGTLAVTVAGGAGVAAVNLLHDRQEYPSTHTVYEEFLGRYQTALETDYEVITADCDRFWAEVSEDIWKQNPDADMKKYNEWHLDYIPGEDFQEGIPVPDTLYEPNMDDQWLRTAYRQEDEEIRYAYYDADGDGTDELFIARFYRGEMQMDVIDVYMVKDGKLIRGKVDWNYNGTSYTWELEPAQEMGYVANNDIVYIHMGTDTFSSFPVIDMPDCDWQTFCNYFHEKS